MLSATLEAGLSDYAIGAKIRALRLKKKMGLVELGQHSGLSPALLSKLERGRLFPTLPTLLRIALVFSVGLDYFFAGAREKPLVAVVRKAERVQLPERQDGKDMSYRFESLDYPATERRFNSYYAEFLPMARDNVRLHTHAGVEFIYTLKGRLNLHIDGQEHALESGDSMYFDSGLPHGYRRSGTSTCCAIVVTTAGSPSSTTTPRAAASEARLKSSRRHRGEIVRTTDGLEIV
jgi:transcriptional regulator with XRE-family HTH domain